MNLSSSESIDLEFLISHRNSKYASTMFLKCKSLIDLLAEMGGLDWDGSRRGWGANTNKNKKTNEKGCRDFGWVGGMMVRYAVCELDVIVRMMFWFVGR